MKIIEIFWRFLILGLTSFGGPAAHIGYFRQIFVEKLQWLTMEHFSRLIALSQFLPGPGSSQLGFAIGLHRAGVAGAVTSFIAFTLPSFLLLYFLFLGFSDTSDSYLLALIHGLKLLALVVVLDAILVMWQNFCQNNLTRLLAIISALLLLLPNFYTQIVLLVGVVLIGALFLQQPIQSTPEKNIWSLSAKLWLALMMIIFVFSFFPWQATGVKLFSEFYQAGSLVFGGGHVVLPLLQQTLSSTVPQDSLLTAYAAAQIVPGPMFTMATYLGAESLNSNPLLGAVIATVAIFLPGFLLILALHKNWQSLAQGSKMAGAIFAVNASVVGFLISTLINPVAVSALTHWLDIIIALTGFILLKQFKISVFWLILLFSSYGLLFSFLQVN